MLTGTVPGRMQCMGRGGIPQCIDTCLLVQGKHTALGNLPGSEESAAPFQGDSQEALPAKERQYRDHLSSVD